MTASAAAGYALFVASVVGSYGIRRPYLSRTRVVPVARSGIDWAERAALGLVGVGVLALPLAWPWIPMLRALDYPMLPGALAVGGVLVGVFLVLFALAHADLGDNWSVTLEVREHHTLVTNGIYRRIRHPMYAALFAWSLAQLCLIPNLVAGPAGFLAFLVLYLSRVGKEEAMMRAEFGADYDAYAARTGRLWPRRA